MRQCGWVDRLPPVVHEEPDRVRLLLDRHTNKALRRGVSDRVTDQVGDSAPKQADVYEEIGVPIDLQREFSGLQLGFMEFGHGSNLLGDAHRPGPSCTRTAIRFGQEKHVSHDARKAVCLFQLGTQRVLEGGDGSRLAQFDFRLGNHVCQGRPEFMRDIGVE
ncbi:Uncharacterised protein [Mycobacterium tuberculosis]|nr:Uncharacterised protein [Mycobacterium tuberculosis]